MLRIFRRKPKRERQPPTVTTYRPLLIPSAVVVHVAEQYVVILQRQGPESQDTIAALGSLCRAVEMLREEQDRQFAECQAFFKKHRFIADATIDE